MSKELDNNVGSGSQFVLRKNAAIDPSKISLQVASDYSGPISNKSYGAASMGIQVGGDPDLWRDWDSAIYTSGPVQDANALRKKMAAALCYLFPELLTVVPKLLAYRSAKVRALAANAPGSELAEVAAYVAYQEFTLRTGMTAFEALRRSMVAMSDTNSFMIVIGAAVSYKEEAGEFVGPKRLEHIAKWLQFDGPDEALQKVMYFLEVVSILAPAALSAITILIAAWSKVNSGVVVVPAGVSVSANIIDDVAAASMGMKRDIATVNKVATSLDQILQRSLNTQDPVSKEESYRSAAWRRDDVEEIFGPDPMDFKIYDVRN